MKRKKITGESLFISIERQTLILKNGGKWGLSYETKALIHLSQWGECVYGPSDEKKGDFYMNLCLSQLTEKF